MKKITFLFTFLLVLQGFSQTLPLDYEDGTTTVSFQFDGAGISSANIANPDVNATNPSSRVLNFNKPETDAAWFSGFGYSNTNLVDLANGTSFTLLIWSNKANLPIRMRLQGGSFPAYNVDLVLTDANQWVELEFDFTSQVNGDEVYPEFVIQPDFNTANEGNPSPDPIVGDGVYYFDDIAQVGDPVDPNTDASLSDLTLDATTITGFSPTTLTYDVELANGTATAPTVAGTATQAGNGASAVDVTQAPGVPGSATLEVTAPDGTTTQTYTVNFTEAPALPPAAPTPPDVNAISIISDVFSNITVPLIETFGGTFTDQDLNSDSNNEALSYTGGTGFQYNFFPGSAFVDITDAAFMHFDFYAEGLADNDILRIRLLDLDPGANGANIARLELSAAQSGTWVSVDLELPSGSDLNDFGDVDSAGSPVDLSVLALIQFNTADLGSSLSNKEIFLSNIYFYGGALSTPDFGLTAQNVKVSPNPTETIWNLSSTTMVDEIQVFDILGKNVLNLKPSALDVEIDASNLKSGLYLARISSAQGTKTIKLIKN